MNTDGRLRFFFGIMITLILNYFFLQILWQFIFLGENPSLSQLFIFWFGYALVTISASIFGNKIYQLIFNDSLKDIPNYYDCNLSDMYLPLKSEERPESVNSNNKKFSNFILTALVLLTLIYLPLDFLGYLIPGLFEYQLSQLQKSATGVYLLWSFSAMIIATIIIHLFIASREETFFRGLIISIGQKNMTKSEALIYSASIFGLIHFAYIFSKTSENYSPFYPIWWGLNAFVIGIFAAYALLSNKNIYSVILAHWLNNVVSATVTKILILGYPLIKAFYYLYLPSSLIGIIIIIKYKTQLSNHIKELKRLLIGYLKPETLNMEEKNSAISNTGQNIRNDTKKLMKNRDEKKLSTNDHIKRHSSKYNNKPNSKNKEKKKNNNNNKNSKSRNISTTKKSDKSNLTIASLKNKKKTESTFTRIALDIFMILFIWFFIILLL